MKLCRSTAIVVGIMGHYFKTYVACDRNDDSDPSEIKFGAFLKAPLHKRQRGDKAPIPIILKKCPKP